LRINYLILDKKTCSILFVLSFFNKYSHKPKMMFKRCFHSTLISQKNFYEILQLNERADKKLIKSSYYKLSKQYHPDLNPNNKDAHIKFLEINEAYAILGNEASKSKYDGERIFGGGHTSSNHTSPSYSRTGGGNSYTQAWRARNRTPKSTGSTSARAQADAWRKTTEGVRYNTAEHYSRHYEQEEVRRRLRMENAANRRRAAGDPVPGSRADEGQNTWSRFWRLGAVLTGISYATQTIV
jgi:curved DNA-binding protein CbpA